MAEAKDGKGLPLHLLSSCGGESGLKYLVSGRNCPLAEEKHGQTLTLGNNLRYLGILDVFAFGFEVEKPRELGVISSLLKFLKAFPYPLQVSGYVCNIQDVLETRIASDLHEALK